VFEQDALALQALRERIRASEIATHMLVARPFQERDALTDKVLEFTP
jgi:hypothetical protein